MKTQKFLLATLALLLSCSLAQAQFGRLGNVVENAARRTVERKVEQKTEEAVGKAIDKAFEKADEQREKGEAELEKALDKAAEKVEEAQKAQEEADAAVGDIPDEIPQVGSAPYTPSESEFAFFPMKKGAVQIVAAKDAKGKITSQTRNTIQAITGARNAFAIEYESEALDAKGKPANKDNPLVLNYRVVVKDGVMYLDMKGMFGTMDGLEGVQVSGKSIRIPNNLTVGQTLDDASAKVKIGFINCSAVMTEGKCLAIEDVTVEAGTFRCYKVSQKTNATIMGGKIEGTTITWYAKGAGAVKTETYDKNGKLQSIQELISNQ